MKAKEKAEKLTHSFLTASFGVMQEYVPVPYEFAKQCALIAVDELIKETDWNETGYWQKVKQEIINL